MAILPWGMYSPSRKIDMISEVYVKGNTTASDLVFRLNEKFGIVCTRNAIIGTYGRSADLKQQFPLTGATKSSVKITKAERTRRNEERRIKSDAYLKAKALRAQEASVVKAEQTKERSKKRTEFEQRQAAIAAKRSNITAWEDRNSVGVDLMGLREGSCKWPITYGSPFSFCGRDTSIVKHQRQIYCSYHNRLAYDPSNNGAWEDE